MVVSGWVKDYHSLHVHISDVRCKKITSNKKLRTLMHAIFQKLCHNIKYECL